MAANYTEHYQLNQWEAEDKVLRAEFNEDNAKIDKALRDLSALTLKIAVGTYSGDGASVHKIPLEFTPQAVYVCTEEGLAYSTSGSGFLYGGLAVTGAPSRLDRNGTKYNGLVVGNSCFYVYETAIDAYSAVHSNYSGWVYHYIAIG